MSFKTATHTPSSAVAQNGTFTLAYPDGTTAGSFAAYGHYLFARGLQALFSQDDGEISVAFGASEITVTYKGATPIPANSVVSVQLNMAGQDDGRPDDLTGAKRVAFAPLVRIDLGSPDAADANGIAESQSVSANAAFVLDGVYADPYGGAKAVLDVPRALVASWTGTAVITVTGKDEYGDVIVEKSGSGTGLTGKKAFKEITSITTSASITSATVGTGDVLGLPVYVGGAVDIVAELVDGADAVAALTEDGGAIGGTNDGDLPDLTATVVEIDNQTGQTADAQADIEAAAAGACAGGSSPSATNVDTAIATAVAPLEVNDATLGAAINQLAADNAALRAAIREVANTVNLLVGVRGTFVGGVQTTPTATTGDVKGTYTPADSPDGSTAFALIARLADPTYLGVDNYDG